MPETSSVSPVADQADIDDQEKAKADPPVGSSTDGDSGNGSGRAGGSGGGGGGDDGSDEGDDADVDELEPEETTRRKGHRQIDARLLLAIVVVVALAAGAYLLGQRQGKNLVDSKTQSSTEFKTPKEFVTLNDPETGVKISVPKDWVRYSTRDVPDKAIRITVGIPGTGDTVVVRVNAYSSEITEANLADQKNVFDQLLGAEKITIFVSQATTLGGLPALFYVYRFTDQATGKAGIHAHYFVFQGRKMVSLIFQALPDDRYQTLAPTFDKIANSLEVAPGPPPDFLQSPVSGEPTTGSTAAPGAPTSAPPTSATAPPTTG